jgi:hypothetical protein
VRDQQVRETELFAKICEQIEHGGRGGNVESGRRLIGND